MQRHTSHVQHVVQVAIATEQLAGELGAHAGQACERGDKERECRRELSKFFFWWVLMSMPSFLSRQIIRNNAVFVTYQTHCPQSRR